VAEDLTIETIIGRIEDLPDALVRDQIVRLAAVVRKELDRTLAASSTPEGQPWAPRKRGTRPVLVHARDNVIVRGIGNQIFVQVFGHYARHHRGWVKGGTQRQMIPLKNERLPLAMLDAMRRVIETATQQTMAGAA
jgi:hypothetical protein